MDDTSPRPGTETVGEPAAAPTPIEPSELIVAELLVEEISIDGMCGVY